MLGDGELGSPWKAAARRVVWSLTSVFILLLGVGIGAGALLADAGEYGPALIGVAAGAMLVLLAVHGQLAKGVRIRKDAHRWTRRLEGTGGAGIEIRLRRGPGMCGELMLVCFVVMLCHCAGLAFRGGIVALGMPLALLAGFFAVVVVDHGLVLRLRRAVLITPENLTVELGGEVVSVGWKDIHLDMFEQVSTPNGITVTNRFIEISARGGALSWSAKRRHQIRFLPKRWRRKVIRVGFWLFDHPERVLTTLTSMCRQRDEVSRRVVLANVSTLAYLTGDLEVSPLPSGR